jgi:2-polyprenyl-6-methoxyphenol hydroxylase-like FAD-dependent oxidoreductase
MIRNSDELRRIMRVGVIGAGLAGLALAQRLTGAGVDVQVYERETGPFLRRQGYRITADADGIDALRRCLPAKLFAMVETTSGPTGGCFRITNAALRDAVLVRFDPRKDQQRQLDRETLRRLMLSELQERVHFGRPATSVSNGQHGGADIGFAGCGREEFDFVVVADGIGSRTRPLVLPEANPVLTGYGALYGRVPLHDDGTSRLPEPLIDSGVLALLGAGLAFFFTAMRFQHPPSAVLPASLRSDDPAAGRDYVMWGLIPPKDELESLLRSDPASRLRYAAGHVARAHPLIRALVAATPEQDTVLSQFSAGRIIGPRIIGTAAVLGDAVHPMPPLGAHGGNTALRDAALLGDLLLDQPPAQNLTEVADEYHRRMSAYATPAVRAAEKQLGRLSGGPGPWVLQHLLPRLHKRTLEHPPRA